MSDWAGIAWLVILLMGNAFFVASEFAVMSARRSQIEPLADAGSKRARTTIWAMEHVSLMLACSQLGITVCSLLILQVAEPAIHHLFVVPFEAVGVPEGLADGVAFALALLLVTFLHVTFGEMVPKNISVSVADKAALLLAPPLVMIARVVHPVISSLNWAANHILRALKVEPKDEVSSTYTLEEVQSIVEESTKSGLVDDESGLITSALEFSGQTAETTMIPLSELVTVRADATPEDFERAVGRTGFSRFVMVDEHGNLTGYMHLKDIMSMPQAMYRKPITENKVRTLANLPLNEEIEDALAVMQRTGSHVARVLGPDGSTRGVLFLEDVIEQLIGEIRDATQNQGARRTGEGVNGTEAPVA
ncbi:CBS domain containing-hemolysin-like protein [Arthrobacter sp. PL16]|uniref:HlyC/CorC family transporter n=1 Tax=Arthrobacter cheniae TaxID=1258888 RepID=A0A3A5M9H8_9MICC|nr:MULTISPECIES: hemolysin family protein [Arthrobacter]MEC5198082.1 CBS domain containing-hemolysin-like protein [Arthrobacter sp. PL16]RJT82173.1 HlyC/CorC family transporter [Arthrobacter cheniae]